MYFFIFILCVNTRTSMIKTNVFFRFYCFSGTNYFVWCTGCYDQLKPDHPYPIANRTIKKDMLLKKKNNQVQGEPWVQCDMCNKWMHQVREICIVPVGGTRCVTSSTANNMNRHARITLTVEVIRTCIFLF